MLKPFISRFLSVLAIVTIGVTPCRASVEQDESIDAMQTAIVNKLDCDQALRLSMKAQLTSFEERMKSQGLEGENLKVCKLLESELKNNNEESMITLCKHLINELADPSLVNQGNHNTCALASLETVLCTKLPFQVCSIILEAAKGKLRLQNGLEIKIPEANLAPDRESRFYRPGSTYRSYASQLFQIAAANIYWQSRNKDPRGMKVQTGSITYLQDYGVPCFRGDTGERLIISWAENVTEFLGDENGLPQSNPGFTIDAINETYLLISGERSAPSLLAHKARSPGKAAFAFARERDLKEKLCRLKRERAFPAIISVNLASKSFSPSKSWVVINSNGEKKSLSPGTKDNWHVVCINDYDESTGQVQVDNFWGAASDFLGERALSIDDLFLSTCPQQKQREERQNPKLAAWTAQLPQQ